MTRRVVVLGGGAGGVATANRLARHAETGTDVEVVLVDRSLRHVFLPGLVSVLVGAVEPEAISRPLEELVRPGVRFLHGEVTTLDPEASKVVGSFGEVGYDELVIALGADVGWPPRQPHRPQLADLAPWTMAGALAGRDVLHDVVPSQRVLLTTTSASYRCPPALFDLAIRIKSLTGASVTVAHPWPRPLAPFGDGPAAELSRLFADAGVEFRGSFVPADVIAQQVTSEVGEVIDYDVGLIVPPHRPPSVVAASSLAGPEGWPEVDFPTLTHPRHRNVSIIGDLAAPALGVGMAGILAVFEGSFVADLIAATAGGPPAPDQPRMVAICFLDTGETGSFLYCDFTRPATGNGPAACALMPPMRYFRRAKEVFAEEWFTSTLDGTTG